MSGDASSILAGKGFYALPANEHAGTGSHGWKEGSNGTAVQLFDRCQIVRNCPIMPLSSCSRI